MDFLKEVLSEETYKALSEELNGKDIKLANLTGGEYVSKQKHDSEMSALQKQLEDTQNLLSTRTAEYDSLKEKAGDNEALKSEIDSLKANFENEKTEITNNYQKQLKIATVKNAIITGYNPNDVEDIMPNIDIEKISIVDKNVIGLKEQIEPLKESKAYLFKVAEQSSASGLDHSNQSGDNLENIRRSLGLKKEKE